VKVSVTFVDHAPGSGDHQMEGVFVGEQASEMAARSQYQPPRRLDRLPMGDAPASPIHRPNHPHTVAGLIDKRRAIAGHIEHVQREMHILVIMRGHLDATIRIFDPEAYIGPAKRYPVVHQSFNGQMVQCLLGTLREANAKPVTSLEITEKVIAVRGLTADQPTTIMIRKRVGAAPRDGTRGAGCGGVQELGAGGLRARSQMGSSRASDLFAAISSAGLDCWRGAT
jgi:hypothetical protein